ncbi:hypothetical protein B566_EDAN012670 [Ephemera danica]|nr:hypothetical protein B566_EDAN012670 [Ephemera danica]
MPDVKFDHIVSCSSEDSHHPALNLLKPETYRKWRCEKAGEEKATVIIQLEKETLIHTIDIGNNGSATVEVLVGKSSSSEANYQVLLQTSSFMSPSESKSMEQMNRVRMFSVDKFCPDIAKKKWDRIMVRCAQPWGCHQYGLSFIALHSPPEEEQEPEASLTKLGRFVLKDEAQDDIRPGSIFARWKENKDSSPQRPRTGKAPKDNRKALERDTPPPESHIFDITAPPADSPPRRAKSPPPPKKATPVTKKAPAPKKATPKVKKPEKPKVRRPFNQLMKDVTFVMSGFQNPLRANLREQALDMGARYQGDWNPSCTHLISATFSAKFNIIKIGNRRGNAEIKCAFANTPKARQVRGKGKIVKKEWIEHCHRERKLFPWRR